MLVNLKTVDIKEWLKNPNNLYIGRETRFLKASKWANKYRITKTNSRKRVVEKFERFIRKSELLQDIQELKHKNLGCWCTPKKCHGEVFT